MRAPKKRRLALLAIGVGTVLAALPAAADAAGAPQVPAIWTTAVSAAGATLHGEINPQGLGTTYRFEYLTDAAYQSNLAAAEEPFTGAAKAPASGALLAAGGAPVSVKQSVSALRATTTYHYRVTATNSSGTTTSSEATFRTQEFGGGPLLLDDRGFELVSPPDKNGGSIQAPEANHGGGVIQAAPTGDGEITYSSASSFGAFEASGAPPASQYISRRTANGWSTQNITAPAVSGSYGNQPNGVPYQLFSTNLTRALMLNGIHCRGEGSGCPIANPPLPGSGAPEGFQDYYLRDNENDTYAATLTEANAELGLEPEEFNLAFAGSSPDLRHVVLSTCAALTPDATEVPGTEGCDPSEPNLYEWSGGGLSLLNVAPGAELGAQAGAISADGSRVYFTEAGKLYLRRGAEVIQIDAEQGGGGSFQAASGNGAIAFFTKAGHLYRYDSAAEDPPFTTDLTPSGGVKGVLGSSEDGSSVYFQDATGLEQWHEGAITDVAPGSEAAQPSDYPPATGTSRVSADGGRLLFLSKASLTAYDNHDATTGQPDSEVFLWNAAGAGLICLSCNPTGERPFGPSTIAGAYANGAAPGSTDFYKPRNLSATSDRAFFTSGDALVGRDTDKASDAYEWEAQGTGTCAKPAGCLSLISSGTDGEGASFLDASESGDDAYFRTFSSLVKSDPGSADVYDARKEGGFAEPLQPIPCRGDACVPLPQGPEDPSVGSLIPGLPNPPVHFPNANHKNKHHPKKKQHRKKHYGKAHHKRGHQ